MKFETKQLSDGKLTTQMIDQYKSDGFLYPIKILETYLMGKSKSH